MSGWSILLFLLAVLYAFGALMEFPIFFEGNPKTRFMMKKIGKRNLKLVILFFALIFFALAVYLR